MALGLGQLLGGVMLGQMTGLLGDNKQPQQQAMPSKQHTARLWWFWWHSK